MIILKWFCTWAITVFAAYLFMAFVFHTWTLSHVGNSILFWWGVWTGIVYLMFHKYMKGFLKQMNNE